VDKRKSEATMTTFTEHLRPPLVSHALVVADWTADPQAVIDVCAAHHQPPSAAVGLLVPARLHGVDWVGDPYASVGCARRALAAALRLAELQGIPLQTAQVGDPDPIAAITDAVLERPIDLLVLCMADGHLTTRSLAERARKAARIPVSVHRVPAQRQPRHRLTVHHLFAGHCQLEGELYDSAA
jgi:hypothetical protein